MSTQDYSNHTRIEPGYHVVLTGLLLLTLIGSFVNLYKSWGDHERMYSASLIVVLTVCVILVAFFCRLFALKAQDRAIRAEENLRHYVLAGKLIDPRITIRQAIALRFAPDDEFLELAKRAATENITPDAIKKSIRNWRPDLYRV